MDENEARQSNAGSTYLVFSVVTAIMIGLVAFVGSSLLSIKEDVAVIKTKMLYIEKYDARLESIERRLGSMEIKGEK